MDDERLIVSLEARVTEFEKRMKRAEKTGTKSYTGLRRGSRSATRQMEGDMNRAAARINKSLASTTAKVGSFSKAFVGGLAGGAIVGAFAAITTGLQGTIEGIATLGDEAKRSGVDLKTFQEWKFVAEQNRIGIDSMTDGLKELNLRADEFITTGAGPAAEAFARLNFSAADLAKGLEDPGELLLDIIGRLEDLDKAAQIRVSDEIFGGTAGERFVELISQGEDALRKTVNRASEVGAVLDTDVIDKAVEIDRKFGELQARAGAFFKGLVVGAADAAIDLASIRLEIEEINRAFDRSQPVIEVDLDDESVANHADEINDLKISFEELKQSVREAQTALGDAAEAAGTDAYFEAERDLQNMADALQGALILFEEGETSAEQFEEQITRLSAEAETALAEIQKVDGLTFENAAGAVGVLTTALANAVGMANTLRAALPSSSAASSTPVSGPAGGFITEQPGVTVQTPDGNTPRPRSAPNDPDFGIPSITSTGGGGGGGGGGAVAQLSEYAKELADIQGETERLLIEAAELTAVADSGREVGDAMEYARTRAELLYAAQEDGRTITPELRSEIEALAEGYANAGAEAELAADRLDSINENADRGKDALTDMFTAIATGSLSGKEAIKGLLLELAKVQIAKGLASLFGGGGALGGIAGVVGGGLLGRQSGGGVQGGMPYRINEQTNNSEIFVPSQNGAVLNVPQAQAALSNAVGGAGGEQAPTQRTELIIHAAEGVTIETVRNEATAIVRQASVAQDARFNGKFRQAKNDRYKA